MTNAELSVSQFDSKCCCVGPHDFGSQSKYNWFDFVTKWSPFRGRGRKPTPESTHSRDLEEVKYFWNFNLNWIWWWLADSAILHCALYHLSIWVSESGHGRVGPRPPQEIGLSCSPRSNQVSLKLNYHHLFIQPDNPQIKHVCLRKYNSLNTDEIPVSALLTFVSCQ